MQTNKVVKRKPHMHIGKIDIFESGRLGENFVGRPFSIDYAKASILTSDYWKYTVGGIPQGCLLLAFYEGEEAAFSEALLLRALGPLKLPNDNNIISSMVEYYKDDVEVAGRAGSRKESKLDEFTKHEFSFSGLECRILGSFYRINKSGPTKFGADIENFYAANNYKVYKATGVVLEAIVNQRDDADIKSLDMEFKVGSVRYSSSRRFQEIGSDNEGNNTDVPVRISPTDFLGQRTALFGMTRTGKSNTVKKIIEATAQISDSISGSNEGEDIPDYTQPVDNRSDDKQLPIGQIIFDVNGEYANPNLQDEGTAIYDLYTDRVIRYSVLKKPGFEEIKINFYKQIDQGFAFIAKYFEEKGDKADYVKNFLSVGLEQPEEYEEDVSARTRYDRAKAAYFCCLHQAGFKAPAGFKVRFKSCKDINEIITEMQPENGITLEQATSWFTRVWKMYEEQSFFKEYEKQKGREWANEDLKALLTFLTRNKSPGGSATNISGFRKLKVRELIDLHTSERDSYFAKDINDHVRQGKIVIVDLSQDSEEIQRVFSGDICRVIFNASLRKFTRNEENNIIQFYFEEAHNIFPKKEDKDLTGIYNRIAKEGAKLNLGMIYATQEVSSISSNILKNTQNWFIAHLNNEDELKELRKYYDFSDFVDSLVRFSPNNDKGFVRMKTYTNPFVVPVQIDRFLAERAPVGV